MIRRFVNSSQIIRTFTCFERLIEAVTEPRTLMNDFFDDRAFSKQFELWMTDASVAATTSSLLTSTPSPRYNPHHPHPILAQHHHNTLDCIQDTRFCNNNKHTPTDSRSHGVEENQQYVPLTQPRDGEHPTNGHHRGTHRLGPVRSTRATLPNRRSITDTGNSDPPSSCSAGPIGDDLVGSRPCPRLTSLGAIDG